MYSCTSGTLKSGTTFLSRQSTDKNCTTSNINNKLHYNINDSQNHKILDNNIIESKSIMNKNIQPVSLTISQPTIFLPFIPENHLLQENSVASQIGINQAINITTLHQDMPKSCINLANEKLKYNKPQGFKTFEKHLKTLKGKKESKKYIQKSPKKTFRVKSNYQKTLNGIDVNEEDDYEKLVREVRELKQEVLNSKSFCKNKIECSKKPDAISVRNTVKSIASNILVSTDTPEFLNLEDGEIVGEIPEEEIEAIDFNINAECEVENVEYLEDTFL